jgi:hypothetical protein
MAEPAIHLTRAQAIRIVRSAATLVPRDIEHPWACICCGRPSREVADCVHADDCPIGAIKAQLSVNEAHSSAPEVEEEAVHTEKEGGETQSSLWPVEERGPYADE